MTNQAVTISSIPANVVVVDFGKASTATSTLAQTIAAKASVNSEKGSKKAQGGFKDLAVSRSDLLRMNPYDLNIEEGLNCRDMSDPENQAHVDKLAQDIAINGVTDPLTAFLVKGRAFVSDGHCRLLATYRAIEVYGAAIQTVPVKTEDRAASRADIVSAQITRNGTKKPLTVFEMATNFKELLNLGWDVKEIARKAVLPVATVNMYLDLRANATPEIKEMVSSGKVTANFAYQTLKGNDLDGEAATKVLAGAITVAEANGSTRAMPKHAMEPKATKVTTHRAKKTAQSFDLKALAYALVGSRIEETDVEVNITMSKEDFAEIKVFIASQKK